MTKFLFAFLFCLTAFRGQFVLAQYNEPESCTFDFSGSPYYKGENYLAFRDLFGRYDIWYTIEQCLAGPLAPNVDSGGDGLIYETTYSSDHICLNAENVMGAQDFSIGTFAYSTLPSSLYGMDLYVTIPSHIVTTYTTIYPDGNRSAQILPTNDLYMVLNLTFVAYTPYLNNLPTCSTSLGEIHDYPGDEYEATKIVLIQGPDIGGSNQIHIHVQCDGPIDTIGASGGYEPSIITTNFAQPILITRAVVNFSPAKTYELKTKVIDQKTGEVTPGGESPVRIPPSTIAPAPSLHCKVPTNLTKRQIQLTCVDKSTQEAVDGCKVSYNMALGDRDGGHPHSEGRPLGSLTPDMGTTISIPAAGTTIEYVAPEVAGNVDITFTGTGPDQSSLQAMPLTFDIRQMGDDYVPLDGFNWDFTQSKHVNGTYVTKAMKAAVDDVLKKFSDKLQKNSLSVPTILAGGASLPTGGLFDIGSNWKSPHCGHRSGDNLDISYRRLSFMEQKILKEAINKEPHLAFYRGESPLAKNATHWHIFYQRGN